MDLRNVNALLSVVSTLQKVQSELPIQQLLVFLTITREEGLTIGDINQRTGQPKSSGSRNVKILTERASPSREGYGLCEVREDPQDIRRKVVHLTPKGRKLAKQLNDVLNEHYPS